MKAKADKAIPSEAHEMEDVDLEVHVTTLKVVLGDHVVVEGSREASDEHLGGRVNTAKQTA